MKTNYLRISLILIILFAMPVQAGYAQPPSPVTATVDRTSLSENDLLTLTITIDSNESPRVTLPAMDKFTMVRTSRGSQMSIINGEISTQYTYHYLLRPLETGQLTIDSVEVILDGQTFTTDPITIEVSSAGGSNSTANTPGQQDSDDGQLPSRDFFVEAEIDNPNPYLGQQVVYTHRLYTAFSFSEPSYDFPRFTGFWVEDDAVVTERHGRFNGRSYRVRETKIILFPTRTGPLTIDETVLTSRSNLFNSGFVLQTEPIDLEVKPLPDEAPPEFDGAVGLFTIDAEVSNEEAKVDEPITLLVTLTGQGNISAAPDPTWPDIPDWRVFEAQASTFTDFRNGNLIGRRVYERLMVPGVPGKFTIPPVTYTYFDPAEAEYRTVSTDPIELTVEPGAGEAPPPVVIGANKEEIERIGTDIRHIKPVPQVLTTAGTPLTRRTNYWLAWSVPVVLWLLNLAWSQRQRYLRRNVGLARSLRAHKEAKKGLAKARSEAQDLYIAADQILTAYLADKLNQPVVGLTQDALATLLASRNIEAILIKRVQETLVKSDMGRFGPGSGAPNHAEQLLDDTETLIADLEKAFVS